MSGKKEKATYVNVDLLNQGIKPEECDEKKGLSNEQVQVQLQVFGLNETPDVKKSSLKVFLSKFNGLAAWMLEFVAVLSLALQNWINAIVIIALLFLNSFLGWANDMRARKAVDALKQRLQVQSRVLRDGAWLSLAARELVPLDIVRLRTGDIVPADVTILFGEVSVNQSVLTGEALAVNMSVSATAYAGSLIERGEATARVSKTGPNTYFGKTTKLVQTSRPRLHIDDIIARLIRALLIVVVSLVILTIVVLLAQQKYSDMADVVSLLLVLLTSALPVALPAMFTVAQSIGSLELSKKGVLVTRLNASEDAARMTVLCSDKTGTITRNELSVVGVTVTHHVGSERQGLEAKVASKEQQTPIEQSDILLAASLASKTENQDPIDMALLRAQAQPGGARDDRVNSYSKLAYIPFDSARRRTEIIVECKTDEKQEVYHIMKGAVNTLMKICALSQEQMDEVQKHMNENASKGFRTIGVCRSLPVPASAAIVAIANKIESKFRPSVGSAEDKNRASPNPPSSPLAYESQLREIFTQYEFLGLIALSDPPRSDSKEVIARLGELGIRVKMLTGDATVVAIQTAKEVGLGTNFVNLEEEKHKAKARLLTALKEKGNAVGANADPSEEEIRKEMWSKLDIESIDGFGNIYPEDKHAIVKMLQSAGFIVGMTGDGVNDSPALKQAEVGVAMSNATDIAKGASSAVLTTEGLGGVIALVDVGRQIHQRIVTWVINKIVKTFATAIFVIIAFLSTSKFVIQAYHMVLLMFLIDFVTVSLATDNVRTLKKPATWEIPKLTYISVVVGVLIVMESLGMLYIGLYLLDLDSDNGGLQTFTFNILFYYGVSTPFIVRERRGFWSSPPSWPLICACCIEAGLVVLLSAVNFPGLPPISTYKTLIVLGWCVVTSLVINDFCKTLYFRFIHFD